MARHFTLSELLYSYTAEMRGIDNTPSEEIKDNLIFLMDSVLDPIRINWGSPLYVTSGYRCKELNKVVNGAWRSYHTKGLAADIQCKNPTADRITELYNMVMQLDKDKIICIDQLIVEKNKNVCWVHVSTKRDIEKNRHQYIKIDMNG